jgi:hypothetical protein
LASALGGEGGWPVRGLEAFGLVGERVARAGPDAACNGFFVAAFERV